MLTEMRARLVPALLLAASTAAQACGHCVEDKIAAVYDHAAIERALGARRAVVFFAIDGPLRAGGAESRKLEQVLASVPGVGVIKLSPEHAMAALSYAPGRINLAQVQKALERKLAPRGLSLLPLRVMERPGDLAAAGRR